MSSKWKVKSSNMQDNEEKEAKDCAKAVALFCYSIAQEKSSSNLNHPSFSTLLILDPLSPSTVVFFLLQSLYRGLFFFTF